MKLIQLYNSDGNNAGLYSAPNHMNDMRIHILFAEAFAVGKAREEHYHENDYDEDINVHVEADEYLEKHDIQRVFVEIEVNTEII